MPMSTGMYVTVSTCVPLFQKWCDVSIRPQPHLFLLHTYNDRTKRSTCVHNRVLSDMRPYHHCHLRIWRVGMFAVIHRSEHVFLRAGPEVSEQRCSFCTVSTLRRSRPRCAPRQKRLWFNLDREKTHPTRCDTSEPLCTVPLRIRTFVMFSTLCSLSASEENKSSLSFEDVA